MNDLEKQKIINLRNEGQSYRKIALALSVSENTVKSFFRRIEKQKDESEICKNCGQKLRVLKKRKPKTFCCDNCRINFWRKNKKSKN